MRCCRGADRMSASPFSWRVHVMLYTSYMLLNFCTVMPFTMKLEHWEKAVRTTRACFAIALDTQMKHGSVKAKVFSWTILWKWKPILWVSYETSLEIWLMKRMVQWKISTACRGNWGEYEHGWLYEQVFLSRLCCLLSVRARWQVDYLSYKN